MVDFTSRCSQQPSIVATCVASLPLSRTVLFVGMFLLRRFLSSYSTSLLFFLMRATHLTHLISYFKSTIIWEDETQRLVTVSFLMHHLCLGQNIYVSAFIDGWLLTGSILS